MIFQFFCLSRNLCIDAAHKYVSLNKFLFLIFYFFPKFIYYFHCILLIHTHMCTLQSLIIASLGLLWLLSNSFALKIFSFLTSVDFCFVSVVIRLSIYQSHLLRRSDVSKMFNEYFFFLFSFISRPNICITFDNSYSSLDIGCLENISLACWFLHNLLCYCACCQIFNLTQYVLSKRTMMIILYGHTYTCCLF